MSEASIGTSIDLKVVEVSEAGVKFGGEFALRPTSLAVGPGEAVIVHGPSGVGKSTLLRVIARLIDPTEGHVRLWDQSSVARSKRVGMTLEEPRLWPWLHATDTVVTLAGLSGVSVSKREARAVLGELDLSDAVTVRASKLSQGMARRVQLAGALVVGADLLLLDEPTASLDAANRAVVWRCLERRRESGIPMVVATHDHSWAGDLEAARVVELAGQ